MRSQTKDFSIGVDGEANRRVGILCLLDNRHRSSDEYSDFVTTRPVADNVEMHLPSNRLLYRLVKIAEGEGAEAGLREERAASEDGS